MFVSGPLESGPRLWELALGSSSLQPPGQVVPITPRAGGSPEDTGRDPEELASEVRSQRSWAPPPVCSPSPGSGPGTDHGSASFKNREPSSGKRTEGRRQAVQRCFKDRQQQHLSLRRPGCPGFFDHMLHEVTGCVWPTQHWAQYTAAFNRQQ